MSLNDRQMQTAAVIGASLLSVAIGVVLYIYSDDEDDDDAANVPRIEDLEAIEASIASRKKPAKLPQKQMQAPPEEPKVEKVNREAETMPDPPKEKPEPPKPQEIDLKDPLKNVKRRGEPDDSPVGKPTEEVGAFDPNAEGWADQTKGHPFFQRVAKDIHDAWEFPKILSATNPAVGCLHITADGKIEKTKIEKSGEDQLDQSAEDALKQVERKRNANPEPVPADILKAATTRWICFKFNPQSRSE